jgi:hypothetical protein
VKPFEIDLPTIEVQPRSFGDSEALILEISCRCVGMAKGYGRPPSPHLFHEAADDGDILQVVPGRDPIANNEI